MSNLQQVGGVWLPAHEKHLPGWMKTKNQVVDGKLTYQLDKINAALGYVKRFGVAVDVGGHCGLWSMHLVKRFAQVHAFEPVDLHRECFRKNVLPDEWELNGSRADVPGHDVYLDPYALGEHEGMVAIHTTAGSSGDSWVNGAGGVPMKRLDDLLGGAIDFIKLDCEGYELFALRGAEELLKRSRPVVIVEQKPGRAQKFGLPETGAVDYLQSLGAVLRREMSGDYILTWPEA